MVIAIHHFIGQGINRILNPAFFGINKDTYVPLISPAAKGIDPMHNPVEFRFLFFIEGIANLYGFQKFGRGNTRYLKDRKRDVF